MNELSNVSDSRGMIQLVLEQRASWDPLTTRPEFTTDRQAITNSVADLLELRSFNAQATALAKTRRRCYSDRIGRITYNRSALPVRVDPVFREILSAHGFLGGSGC